MEKVCFLAKSWCPATRFQWTSSARTRAVLDLDEDILLENTTCFLTPCPKRDFFAFPVPFSLPTKLEE